MRLSVSKLLCDGCDGRGGRGGIGKVGVGGGAAALAAVALAAAVREMAAPEAMVVSARARVVVVRVAAAMGSAAEVTAARR